jgi:hypothetical protein
MPSKMCQRRQRDFSCSKISSRHWKKRRPKKRKRTKSLIDHTRRNERRDLDHVLHQDLDLDLDLVLNLPLKLNVKKSESALERENAPLHLLHHLQDNLKIEVHHLILLQKKRAERKSIRRSPKRDEDIPHPLYLLSHQRKGPKSLRLSLNQLQIRHPRLTPVKMKQSYKCEESSCFDNYNKISE